MQLVRTGSGPAQLCGPNHWPQLLAHSGKCWLRAYFTNNKKQPNENSFLKFLDPSTWPSDPQPAHYLYSGSYSWHNRNICGIKPPYSALLQHILWMLVSWLRHLINAASPVFVKTASLACYVVTATSHLTAQRHHHGTPLHRLLSANLFCTHKIAQKLVHPYSQLTWLFFVSLYHCRLAF